MRATVALALSLAGCSALGPGPVEPTPTPTDSGCLPHVEWSQDLCSDGLDNDHNGYIDCADIHCRTSLWVTSCGALENTDTLCSDGVDFEEELLPGDYDMDGLVDCADPDCARSPLVTVCPRPEPEGRCADGADDDGDGFVDCDDLDCATACGDRRRVLFDASTHQVVGGANWVIQPGGGLPWPSNPSAGDDWAGAYSSFGVDLTRVGFAVRSLPLVGGCLSWGDASNELDLERQDVLVVPEPSRELGADELDALLAFVEGGGGLLAIANHAGADRDGNGWDAVEVWTALLQRSEQAGRPWGVTLDAIDYGASYSGELYDLNDVAGLPLLDGPHGSVTTLASFKGTSFTLDPDVNSTLVPLAWMPDRDPERPERDVFALAGQLGVGRFVFVGDSAVVADGTDSHGQRSGGDHWADYGAFFLNAVEWLAQ